MKVCNYCGTGMDNSAMKCPFCGQPMDVKGAIKFENNEPWNGDTSAFSTIKYDGKTRAERMVEESDRKKKFQDLFKKKEASVSHPEHDVYSKEEQAEYQELKAETDVPNAAEDSDWGSLLTSAAGNLLGQQQESETKKNQNGKAGNSVGGWLAPIFSIAVFVLISFMGDC